MRSKQFQPGKTTYKCAHCGKLTRNVEGEESTGYCLRCYNLMEIENSHMNDDCVADCPFCAADATGIDPYKQ